MSKMVDVLKTSSAVCNLCAALAPITGNSLFVSFADGSVEVVDLGCNDLENCVSASTLR